MPKNTKKEQIKHAIIKDELPLVDIANKFGVKQPYISQLKIEVDRDKYLEAFRFLYKTMNDFMTWKQKPPEDIIIKIKEVRAFI